MAKAASAKAGRKLSKKELKEDRLVQVAYRAEHFFNEHRNQVMGIIAVVVLVIIGGLILQRTMTESRMEESYDVTLAKMAYGQQRYDEARAGFENAINKYSGPVAAEAKYYLTRIDFDQGNFTEAEAGFRDYAASFSGDKYTDCAAGAGLAASLEAQGKPGEAAVEYERVAVQYPDLPFAPEGLAQASRLYMHINQNDNAIRVLEMLLNLYPDCGYTQIAKKDLVRLQ